MRKLLEPLPGPPHKLINFRNDKPPPEALRAGPRAGRRRSWPGYVWLLLPPLATTATRVYLNYKRLSD